MRPILKETDALDATIRQVVAELQLANADREIVTEIGPVGTGICETCRIGQMTSNLLGNALSHGSKDAPVRLGASNRHGVFELFVANAGEAIPPDKLARLFQPFFRGEASGAREGLGLGLHIASQIAEAHGGTLTVSSDVEETRFTFSMWAKSFQA